MMSEAHVSTPKADRYASRLCKHFAHKIRAEWTPPQGLIEFPELGSCRLTAQPNLLVLQVESTERDKLDRLRDIVGIHLERFGARDGVAVDWDTAR